jgi:hypothetical protein
MNGGFKYSYLYNHANLSVFKKNHSLYNNEKFKKSEINMYSDLLYDPYKYYYQLQRTGPLKHKQVKELFNTFTRKLINNISILDIDNISLPAPSIPNCNLVNVNYLISPYITITISHPTNTDLSSFAGTSYILLIFHNQKGFPLILYGSQNFINDFSDVIITCATVRPSNSNIKPIHYHLYDMDNYIWLRSGMQILTYPDKILNINISTSLEPVNYLVGSSFIPIP